MHFWKMATVVVTVGTVGISGVLAGEGEGKAGEAKGKANREMHARRGRKSPIERYDKDGDGKVTYEEFERTHMEGLKKRFEAMDRNSDGVFSEADRKTPGPAGAKKDPKVKKDKDAKDVTK